MPDASIPEQVARKIIMDAVQGSCAGCGRQHTPRHLHWSPNDQAYLCYHCGAGKRRGATLREVLQRMTRAAAP